MNAVRSVITIFLLALLTLSVAGLNWAATNEKFSTKQMIGACTVLALCGLLAVFSTILLWRAKQPDAEA